MNRRRRIRIPNRPCCAGRVREIRAVDSNHAPGETWGYWYAPLAFSSRRILVGEAEGLRSSKLPDDQLLLAWDGDCGGGADFGIYRGSLAGGYDSLAPVPGLCDVSGTSAAVPAGDGPADLFLVVPWVFAGGYGSDCAPDPTVCRCEGSYGADSGSNPRPQPATHCYPQRIPPYLHDCAP